MQHYPSTSSSKRARGNVGAMEPITEEHSGSFADDENAAPQCEDAVRDCVASHSNDSGCSSQEGKDSNLEVNHDGVTTCKSDVMPSGDQRIRKEHGKGKRDVYSGDGLTDVQVALTEVSCWKFIVSHI